MRKFISKDFLLAVLAIFIFTIPIALPLLHKGYFLSDDGEWMVVRLTAFFEALRHGQIPVRFLIRLSNEYGYPLSNFAYPGFLYLGSLIHLFKIGYIVSIKIIFFLSFFLSGIFAYQFLKTKFDKMSSIFGSFIYVYTPYHLFDLYRRGSIGELLAISVIPFLFWQIKKKNKYLIAIGIFLLILAHNSIALISLPFIFLYSLLENRKEIKKQFIWIVFPYLMGLFMSAFFFIPSVYDLRFIVFQGLKIADWHLFFGSITVVGISTIIILILSIYVWFKNKKNIELSFFLVMTLISVFMGTAISTFVWNVIPSSFVIFPFRFLSILPMGLAFLSASIIFSLKKNPKYLILSAIVVLSFYSSSFFLTPTKYLETDDNYYLNNFASTTANNEYTPKWVKERPLDIPSQRALVVSGDAFIESSDFNSKRILVSASGNNEFAIRVNIVYFPGWVAFVDGKATAINYQNKNGVMIINIPPGSHKLILEYKESGVHLYSDVISILAVLSLGILFVKERINVSKKS